MKANHTDITIILDRSGSMSVVAEDTIGGFNRFLDDQQKAPGSATITLHQFDTEYETVIDAKDIQEAKPLSGKTFVPRGMTALYDAIGRAVTATGARLAAMDESQRPEHVICVIITDGMENSSREFSGDRINEMIGHQRDKYKWEFVFLGANQDAIKTGEKLGIQGTNSITYAHNAKGVQAVFASTSDNMAKMRKGLVRSMAYSTEDREEQEKAGVTIK